ncbi:GNAT family N-acetyltransferase [Companilactobacillus alimentarius]|uniref:N-acetyltransferase domain-containing protein n=1 Tax=Companilactobacillus alimentarius DSM 20249 TaxID=1423720 RepID=A0A2K9HJA3_9LACO|nr:GNAT family N-acetyltransferase [Companilactobacillus alimentarius]AUI72620.1 hypothetical protein LA20249_10675 [Companilactobacillus alimentarius DSM 20249]MDT6952256.1 GNAT family N-acetyltransferase [Companilactobacillus alimentarius]GEO45630.1 N-acetyltransferase [Companilactobacillus alimentarius]
MDIQKLSSKYTVRPLVTSDTEIILKLNQSNPLYFKYCPPAISRPMIRHDMTVVPPHTSKDDKYYLGFFDGDKLVAMLDLVLNYPEKENVWIGLFMVDAKYSGKGIGTDIMNEIFTALSAEGFKEIGLAYAKGNPQSEHFLAKIGFFKTGVEEEEKNYHYTAVVVGQLLDEN